MPTRTLKPAEFPPTCRCSRCEWTWRGRTAHRRPLVCPNCRSRRWHFPKEVLAFLETDRQLLQRLRREAAVRKGTP